MTPIGQHLQEGRGGVHTMPDCQMSCNNINMNMGQAEEEEETINKTGDLPLNSNNNGVCAEERAMVFVYGTLKRGFGNHWLMEEMIGGGHAEFVGIGRSEERYPLVCGPYQVPFLLYFHGFGEFVFGELYAIDSYALHRFDDLEGTTKGHYIRRPIRLRLLKMADQMEDEKFRLLKMADQMEEEDDDVVESQAYFAGNSYSTQMWMKTRNNCLSTYSVAETKNYVRRKDRPPHLSFLDHIDIFLSQESTHAPPPPTPPEITAGH